MQYLSGVKVSWASVHAPNEMSGKLEVTATHLNPEQIKFITGLGQGAELWNAPHPDKKNPENGIVCKFKTGTEFPPKIVDINNKPIPKDVLIGNGSVCNIAFNVKHNVKAGTATKTQTYLTGIQVLELVPYKGKEMFAAEENGTKAQAEPF